MFKLKKVEEMKSKIKKIKIVVILLALVFIFMLANIVYLDFKVSELQKIQNEIISTIP